MKKIKIDLKAIKTHNQRPEREETILPAIQSIQEAREKTVIEKIDYKTKDLNSLKPLTPSGEGIKSRKDFLKHVAKAIKIAQIERDASERKLSDNEKIELVRLEREFEPEVVILEMERQQRETADYLRSKSLGIYESETEKASLGADAPSVSDRKRTSEKKMRVGGGKGGEVQLIAILNKHKKQIGWTEEEFHKKLKQKAGKARIKQYKTAIKLGKPVKKVGRKKGTVFSAKEGKFIRTYESPEATEKELK